MTLAMACAFALAMLVQAAVPGPGVFSTVARALAGGLRPGLAFALGIVAGDILYALLAVFALAAVARSLGSLFVLVKLLGGLYLVWLGIRLWRTQSDRQPSRGSLHPTRSLVSAFFGGLVTTLSNPKAILFYGGFLPAFFDLSSFTTRDTLLLLAIVSGVLFAVLTGYVFLASQARALFQSHRARRRLNRFAGTAMIATGVLVATRR